MLFDTVIMSDRRFCPVCRSILAESPRGMGVKRVVLQKAYKKFDSRLCECVLHLL
jgi:hypothetical protein